MIALSCIGTEEVPVFQGSMCMLFVFVVLLVCIQRPWLCCRSVCVCVFVRVCVVCICTILYTEEVVVFQGSVCAVWICCAASWFVLLYTLFVIVVFNRAAALYTEAVAVV